VLGGCQLVRGPAVAHSQQQQRSANHSAGGVAQAADQSWDDHGPADEVMVEELQMQCPPAGVAAASCTIPWLEALLIGGEAYVVPLGGVDYAMPDMDPLAGTVRGVPVKVTYTVMGHAWRGPSS